MCEYIKDEICQTEDMRKIFVGNIHLETTDDELKTFMEEHSGDTVEHVVIIRPKSKTPKYYMGFCTFTDSDTPDELFLKRDELEIRGVKLMIKRAIPKNDYTPGAHEKVKKLFVANLPKDGDACKDEDLKKYFEQRHNPRYGTIEKVQLIKEKGEDGALIESKNRGFGFIFVSSEDFCDKLYIQHHKFQFMERSIELKKNVSSGGDGGDGGQRGGRGGMRGGRGRGGQGGGYGGQQEVNNWKNGDWMCTSCNAHNFSSKDVCFKKECGAPKPDATGAAAAGGWGGDQGWGNQGWGGDQGYGYDQSYDSYYGGGGGYGGGYAAGGYGEHQHARGGRGGGRGRGRGRGASW